MRPPRDDDDGTWRTPPPNKKGLQGDVRRLVAGRTAQLVQAWWPSMRVLLITGSSTGGIGIGARFILETGLESAELFREEIQLANFSRVVVARSAKLIYQEANGFVGTSTVIGSVVEIDATVDANLLLPGASAQLGPTTLVFADIPTAIVSTLLIAANPKRMGLSIYNESPAGRNLFIKSFTSVTLLSFKVRLVPGAYWEAPSNWAGAVAGIWDGADAAGFAHVEEYRQ